MLFYAAAAAGARGADVHFHTWSGWYPDPFTPAIEDWVRDDVAGELDRIGGAPLLVGKSLGSNGAAVAAERGLPAVWLTPMMSVPWVPAALARATAPFLLAGGTADPMWDGPAAATLTPYVFEAGGADHGLFGPGTVADSIDILKGLVAAIDGFLDTIGWPG
jgi:hypothetical protein